MVIAPSMNASRSSLTNACQSLSELLSHNSERDWQAFVRELLEAFILGAITILYEGVHSLTLTAVQAHLEGLPLTAVLT